MLSILCYAKEVQGLGVSVIKSEMKEKTRETRSTYADAVVLDERESVHETDVYEPSVARKVVFEVAFDGIGGNSTNVETATRHCRRTRDPVVNTTL